ncbi:hypothetical protein SmJEL517_g02730 [Synchytrium microbalum]|uniref:Chitin-binding type-1 domain-containing protein n=1 Tax=Synchytrium microbalum TaxID=1806994 RepID=A0A507C5H1_9FUNG|nr:uncharacterized protein SmJEL517_g02730 [Synchytrium microbalum]TPX34731.1 hypothetical protein SmJEL517_g02730 [Synchytrium microbalum]
MPSLLLTLSLSLLLIPGNIAAASCNEILKINFDASHDASTTAWSAPVDDCIVLAKGAFLYFRATESRDFQLRIEAADAQCAPTSNLLLSDLTRYAIVDQNGGIDYYIQLDDVAVAKKFVLESALSTGPTIRDAAIIECSNLRYKRAANNTGSCGAGAMCAPGYCCSKYSYCGRSSAYCGTGCQPLYGTCNATASVSPAASTVVTSKAPSVAASTTKPATSPALASTTKPATSPALASTTKPATSLPLASTTKPATSLPLASTTKSATSLPLASTTKPATSLPLASSTKPATSASASPKASSTKLPSAASTSPAPSATGTPGTLGASCVSACSPSTLQCIDGICQRYWAQPTWTSTAVTATTMLNGWNATKLAYDAGRKVVTDPAGSSELVMKVVYPAGSRDPATTPVGGTGFYAEPISMAGVTHITIQYDVFFPTGFNFVNGGKLPGGYGGHASCSGGASASDCYSTRHMWRASGAGEAYLYLYQPIQLASFCLANICDAAYGVSVGRGDFTFKTGVWNTIRQKVKLNSVLLGVAMADGTLEEMWSVNEATPATVITQAGITWRQIASVAPLGLDAPPLYMTHPLRNTHTLGGHPCPFTDSQLYTILKRNDTASSRLETSF